jgi:fructokinase
MSGRPVIFGEVLFDHFPDGRRVLGGAPFNVAWNLQAFGADPFLVSRIGRDLEGEAVRAAMHGWGLNDSGLETDRQLRTGKVQVHLDQGEPRYEIVCPSAWDAIATPTSIPDMALLYHGSLALRQPDSRRSWQQLRDRSPGIVFVDVNLRAPWWDRGQVLDDLRGADWVKLNREELEHLAPGTSPSRERAQAFLQALGLQGLALTDGERGAEVFTADGRIALSRPASDVQIVDTVGAGDALASVIILGLLRRWPLQLTLDRAQSFASAIVGQRGATVRDRAFYEPFRNFR